MTRQLAGLEQEVRVGRDASFADFFDATWPDLIAFCTTLTSDAHLAEELAQEAFTRVYVRFGLLREPRPYLFRVAANLVRRSWRTTSRTTAYDEALADQRADATAPPDLTLDAVRRLPDRLRDVVLLHYYADLPVAEVGRLLRRPTGTVKRRLHEARTQLAVDLGRELDA